MGVAGPTERSEKRRFIEIVGSGFQLKACWNDRMGVFLYFGVFFGIVLTFWGWVGILLDSII